MSDKDKRLNYSEARAILVDLGVIDDEGEGSLVSTRPSTNPPTISQEK